MGAVKPQTLIPIRRDRIHFCPNIELQPRQGSGFRSVMDMITSGIGGRDRTRQLRQVPEDITAIFKSLQRSRACGFKGKASSYQVRSHHKVDYQTSYGPF